MPHTMLTSAPVTPFKVGLIIQRAYVMITLIGKQSKRTNQAHVLSDKTSGPSSGLLSPFLQLMS
jgi:hypothetical protein